MRISWTAPTDNFKPITAYDIEIRDTLGSNYIANTANCDGSAGSAAVTDTYCDIPVSVLRAPPYNLVLQQLVVARVRAINSRGPGSYSPDNTVGALIQTEPSAMAAPTRGAATTASAIQAMWSAVTSPQDGYSAVTSYELYWDAGAGSAAPWQALAGVASNYLLTSYLVTTSITAGAQYRFKIRAKNFWGVGADSPVATIQAATTPGTPTAPVTSYDASTGGVVITWTAPTSNGSPITSFQVEIEQATAGVWTSPSVYCTGTTATTCTVPMSALWAAPWNLLQGRTVAARVTAVNAYGSGTASAASTGAAKIRVKPTQMSVPVRGATTSTTQIEAKWTALSAPNDGDSTILSYNV